MTIPGTKKMQIFLIFWYFLVSTVDLGKMIRRDSANFYYGGYGGPSPEIEITNQHSVRLFHFRLWIARHPYSPYPPFPQYQFANKNFPPIRGAACCLSTRMKKKPPFLRRVKPIEESAGTGHRPETVKTPSVLVALLPAVFISWPGAVTPLTALAGIAFAAAALP